MERAFPVMGRWAIYLGVAQVLLGLLWFGIIERRLDYLIIVAVSIVAIVISRVLIKKYILNRKEKRDA